jgi:hypothetical protein
MPIIGTIASSRRVASGAIAGYFAGGITGGTNSSSIFKYAFTGEVVSTISATLGTARYSRAGLSNYQVAGYMLNGYLAGLGNTNVSEKLTYATEARSSLSNTTQHAEASAMTNSGTAGYQGGGWGGSSDVATTLKYTYSNDTEGTSTNIAVTGRVLWTYANNKGGNGYYGYGTSGVNLMYRYVFSNETTSSTGQTFRNISTANYPMGVSNEGVCAYAMNIDGATTPLTIDKLPFSTETRSNVSATIAQNNVFGSVTNGANYGILSTTGTGSSKLNYTNDTLSSGSSFSAEKSAPFALTYSATM